ncbi:MAG: adenylosuccinate synthase [Bacteroidales bacterium]|nr:adenylosuccinate synthase [Bacteroidales bacterium]
MKLNILIGLQWGDEGKGKVVDVLCQDYNVIARFQGGPNAGHTLEINSVQTILHTIPSGIFRKDTINIVGNGVVLDPVVFSEEINELKKQNIDLKGRLLFSRKAHLILPTHRILDAASEAAKGITKIGSTLKGIGPTYMDKTGRNGLRIGDIELPDFKDKYLFLKQKHQKILQQYDYKYDEREYENLWFKGIELLKQFVFVDSEHVINNYLKEGKKILAEGAQGTLLDIDFGSYPYVTSSNTICAGACTGLGIAPSKIGEVIGIVKAYCTRVGGGPFPTEQNNETGEKLRKIGHEYGATTGRPRRCGWLDLVALKYSIMLNGVTQMILTKTDILSEFETIKICTGYRTKNGIIDYFPYTLENDIEPIYAEFKGWKCNISKIKSEKEIPKELIEYILFIEKETGVPIKIISVGAERNETIFR